MNLRRTLSRQQLFWLKRIATGQLVLRRVEGTTADYSSDDHYYVSTGSKPSARCGSHLAKAVVVCFQRGLIAEARAGRLVTVGEAARQFGSPPEPVPPKRAVRMWRTRAAREQGST